MDTEQEHEVAEALFDLANMFARPAPFEQQRKPAHPSAHSGSRLNGAYGKMHRGRGDQEQYRDHGSPKRQISLPDREVKKIHTRDWHIKDELPSRSTAHQLEAGLADASPGGNVSIPRAVKAAQHVAAPGPTSLGSGSAAPVSLGLGAFHPGVPPGLPAYFRNGGQGQSVTNSDGHSGQWASAGGQSAGHIAHAREVPDSGMPGAFSKPGEGNSVPRPKSLRRSANHVYIAHMIVEWQHQLSRLRHQKPYQQPASNLSYSASLPYSSEPGLQQSQSGNMAPAAPRQSSPLVTVKQEQPASLPQQSAPPPAAAMPGPTTSAFQFAPAFNLAAMRPPTSQHPPGPRDSSGNIIPPAQYYKNMLGPQKFEALQPRLPLLQPGATWPMGPPGGPSPFVSAPPMLSPQQAAAFAAQMSMFAAAPHALPGLPGFPSAPLQAQLASSQSGQSGFLQGVRWPDAKVNSSCHMLSAFYANTESCLHVSSNSVFVQCMQGCLPVLHVRSSPACFVCPALHDIAATYRLFSACSKEYGISHWHDRDLCCCCLAAGRDISMMLCWLCTAYLSSMANDESDLYTFRRESAFRSCPCHRQRLL